MLNLIMCIALATATGPIRTSTNPENSEVISATWAQVTVQGMKPFTSFAVGSKYHIFGLNREGIYNIIPPYGIEFRFQDHWQGYLSALDVGSDGTVWGANLYGQFFYPTQFGKAKAVQLPHATNVTIGNSENIWALDSSHNVYHYVDGNWFQKNVLPMSSISAADDGSVIGLYLDGSMAWYENGSWTNFTTPSTFTIAKIGNSTNIWALNAGGQVWNWNPNKNPNKAWQGYSGFLRNIDVASDGTVMGLDSYGNLLLLKNQ